MKIKILIKKFWFAILIPLSIIGGVSGVAIYKLVNDSSINYNLDFDTTSSSDDIFPNLEAEDFLKYVVITNRKPIINDDFIAKVIYNIINGLGRSDGLVNAYVKKNSNTNVIITFEWVKDDEKILTSYQIKIEMKT